MPADERAFRWHDGLDASRYCYARYRVSSLLPGDETALGMAMEQSAATLHIAGYVTAGMLDDWTIRIAEIRELDVGPASDVPGYMLDTEVYSQAANGRERSYEILLAVPLCLIAGKPAQLLNVLVGEIPRLGFVTGFRLLETRFPGPLSAGPAFGSEGILVRAGVDSVPLLCRSTRPAVGLDMETMANLNRDVLVGGFHLVKDDELLQLADAEHFERHLLRMIRARDEAREVTGERKQYIANLICEPDEFAQRWDKVCELGVDGVLVAPFIQGLGLVSSLAKQGVMPILAHNVFSDLVTRNPAWGIDDAVVCSWLRQLGADWLVSPGGFAQDRGDSDAESAWFGSASGQLHGLRASMPILQGGKSPHGLAEYARAVGNRDFMLIVASWVDGHPKGVGAAAREFRERVDARDWG